MKEANYLRIIIENKPIYCLGDLHGATSTMLNYIRENDLTDCVLIILGDIGLGFNNLNVDIKIWTNINTELKNRGIHLFCLRGNHDDPSLFNREIIDVEKEQDFWYENVKMVPDYSVISINGKNLLLIGGATSIDRIGRMVEYQELLKGFKKKHPKLSEEEIKFVLKPSYFPSETPFCDKTILQKLYEDDVLISHVLTHTAPSFCYPRTKKGITQWLEIDEKLKDDLDNERKTMDEIYNCLIDTHQPLEEWVYGHFHYHHQEEKDFVRFTTLLPLNKTFDAYEITRKDM